MYSRINDRIYRKILGKIDNGTFKKGTNCKLNTYYFENKTISDFRIKDRTPEVCASLMDYDNCRLIDVPKTSITRSFLISTFTDKDVIEYIKSDIDSYDREFFKDVIESNRYSTFFNDTNVFEVMPIEYIDEEMCSLAAIHSLDWSSNGWVYSVLKRKPEALTEDLWLFIIRFYGDKRGSINRMLSLAPEEYKTEEFYKQMCRCNYNCGISLYSKGKVMEDVPPRFLTENFLMSLIYEDEKNVAMFSDFALETLVKDYENGECIQVPLWKFIIKYYGQMIQNIPLNDERCEYFLSLYPKDSNQYKYGFKRVYKEYMKQKEDKSSYERKQERMRADSTSQAFRILFGAMLYSQEGLDPMKVFEDEMLRQRHKNENQLPIYYRGRVPEEYSKIYDSEEYLAEVYKSLGIKIIEEYDNLFYRVILPENLTINSDNRYHYQLQDLQGNTILTYFYDSKIYDRDAYVRDIALKEEGIKLIKK